MNIFPAIDLMDGQVVRLTQGRFEDRTVYPTDPVELAARYADAGARFLHVVDLDGARRGEPVHTALLTRIAARTGLRVQVGGGIRTAEHVTALLDSGVDRVILGSLAVTDPENTQAILRQVGPDRISLAVDVRIGDRGQALVATHGWQSAASITADALIERYLPKMLSRVLCTDISRDGLLTGPNLPLYRDLASRFPDVAVLASGGVATLDDLRALTDTGAWGVIIGKALLGGAFTLEQALNTAR